MDPGQQRFRGITERCDLRTEIHRKHRLSQLCRRVPSAGNGGKRVEVGQLSALPDEFAKGSHHLGDVQLVWRSRVLQPFPNNWLCRQFLHLATGVVPSQAQKVFGYLHHRKDFRYSPGFDHFLVCIIGRTAQTANRCGTGIQGPRAMSLE